MSISEQYRELRGGELLHYTHTDNLKGIVNADCIIYSQHMLDQLNIQNTHITDSNSNSIDRRKGYDKYVFLIFSESHPLIYRKQCEGVPIDSISIDISILDVPGVKIADRIATDNRVILYTVQEALIKLDIANAKNERINDRDIWDIVKKYEILVPNHIDLKEFQYKG